MQLKRALSFPFQDDDWFRKVLIPAVCQFIPLLGILLAAGWALGVCRRIIRKDASELPVLEFRRNLADGLAVWGIILVYTIPVLFWWGLAAILSSDLYPNGEAFDAYPLLWWGMECVALAIAFGSAVCFTAAIGRFSETGTFRAAFRMREVFSRIRSAPAAYLFTVLAWLPLAILAASGTAVCCVGVFFTSVYAAAAAFHLAGQAYALSTSRQTSPAVPPPA